MNDELRALLRRADFWTALVGLVAIIVVTLTGTELDQQAIVEFILVVVGIVGGTSAVTKVSEDSKEKKRMQAVSDVKVAQAQAQIVKDE